MCNKTSTQCAAGYMSGSALLSTTHRCAEYMHTRMHRNKVTPTQASTSMSPRPPPLRVFIRTLVLRKASRTLLRLWHPVLLGNVRDSSALHLSCASSPTTEDVVPTFQSEHLARQIYRKNYYFMRFWEQALKALGKRGPCPLHLEGVKMYVASE